MKEEGKPVSFVEDCASARRIWLSTLSSPTSSRSTAPGHLVRARLGGCLHGGVLKLGSEGRQRPSGHREEASPWCSSTGLAFRRARDGIVRSEFHEKMFGPRRFAPSGGEGPLRPNGLFNPGKIVARRSSTTEPVPLRPGYHGEAIRTHLDWSAIRAPRRVPGRGRNVKTMAPAARSPWVMSRAPGERGRARRHRGPQYAASRITGSSGRDASRRTRWRTATSCAFLKACRRECRPVSDLWRAEDRVQARASPSTASRARPPVLSAAYAPYAQVSAVATGDEQRGLRQWMRHLPA